jgi:TPR repeat protein
MLKQKLLSVMVVSFMLLASGQVLGAQGLQSSSDNETPLQTMQRHAEGRNTQAQERLGDAYLSGSNVAEDPNLAAECYQQAANADNPTASVLFKLGFLYAHGVGGLEQIHETAFEYYLSAAEKGSKEAQLQVAQVYDYGLNGIGQNTELAV